jgi:glucose-1-phosphate adenylyltransferase
VVVGRDAIIGKGGDLIPNLERPDVVNSGISIVGKRAIVPSGFHVGRNVVVGPGVQDELLELGSLASGETVHPTQMPLHLYV